MTLSVIGIKHDRDGGSAGPCHSAIFRTASRCRIERTSKPIVGRLSMLFDILQRALADEQWPQIRSGGQACINSIRTLLETQFRHATWSRAAHTTRDVVIGFTETPPTTIALSLFKAIFTRVAYMAKTIIFYKCYLFIYFIILFKVLYSTPVNQPSRNISIRCSFTRMFWVSNEKKTCDSALCPTLGILGTTTILKFYNFSLKTAQLAAAQCMMCQKPKSLQKLAHRSTEFGNSIHYIIIVTNLTANITYRVTKRRHILRKQLGTKSGENLERFCPQGTFL